MTQPEPVAKMQLKGLPLGIELRRQNRAFNVYIYFFNFYLTITFLILENVVTTSISPMQKKE